MSDSQHGVDERAPLLRRDTETNGDSHVKSVDFEEDDPENPRNWSRKAKLTNIGIIALMAILSPLASSMFTPGMNEIAKDLGTSVQAVIGAATGYVVMLGLGPLILAPLSETFGRRRIYISAFTTFSLLQIPTALSPNLPFLIVCRTLAGFFGSVSIANGGGSINDMFEPSGRASIFGWYLLGPLLGPTIGPLLGGIIVTFCKWRWLFWVLTVLCSVNTFIGYIFLRETYAPAILQKRCQKLEEENGGKYTYKGRDTRPISRKLFHSLQRPTKILLTQPIVITMAIYQALIFSIMYTLFTSMQTIFGQAPYNFDTLRIGLLYLGPGSGFLLAVWFLVPKVDTVYNRMSEKNDGESKPEFRLPLANIGAFLLPLSVFCFAWTIQYKLHWLIPIAATPFFGASQVIIFNTCQNYYIDAFSRYAASAIAAGAAFRSVVGGTVPLIGPKLFEKLGYGWGWSIFGFLAIILAPSPLLFMRYGEFLRRKYQIEL